MDTKAVERWVDGYLDAWNSNNPEDIGRLFSEDAAYYTGPFAEPWKGRGGIVESWLSHKDEPGSFSFRYEVLAAAANRGVIRGWTEYFSPHREYSNIWVIELDREGRCTQFTEWWMKRKESGK